MNVLILGCSFGVPNYLGPPGPSPDTHTEFLLQNLGHKVFNCARNGGSNLESLQRAKSFLQGNTIKHPAYDDQTIQNQDNQHIDWIVWFHTELYRDFSRLENKTHKFAQDQESIAHITYSSYKKFQQNIKARLAVIGGAGDLHDCFDDYFSPEFVIRSWRSDILGVSLTSQTVWQREHFDTSKDSVEVKLNQLENDLELINLMQVSTDFPDNCHPGERPHQILAEKLHAVFHQCEINVPSHGH